MLEEGFQVDESYWPLAQTLCEVLFEIGDYEEYERIASHVREHDPQCPSIRFLDLKLAALSRSAAVSGEPEKLCNGSKLQARRVGSKQAKAPEPREVKLLKRAQRGLAHLEDIAADALKKRRVLYGDIQQTLTQSSHPVEYLLERNSWQNLGKLLLQVYEDASSESKQAVTHANVKITVTDFEESTDSEDVAVAVAPAVEKEVDIVDVDGDGEDHADADANATEAPGSQAKTTEQSGGRQSKKKKRSSSFTASESAAGVVPSDNDTQDSGMATSELDEPQPARRKSRRHEERLREEHAAAVKIALEKNLAYRLQTFLPESWSRQLANGTEKAPEKLASWSQQFALKLTGSKFQICDQSNNPLHEFDLFMVAGSDAIGHELRDGSSNSGGPSRKSQDGSSIEDNKAVELSKLQIAEFVSRISGQAPGAVALLRNYLNQCGEWAHMRLVTDNDEIHAICFWAEKLIDSGMDGRQKQAHGTVGLAAIAEQNGLTPRAKLFLLELKFDKLIRQPAHGKQRKRQRQRLLTLIATADSLLLELCWADEIDGPDEYIETVNAGLVRLFWLLARMHERCGRAAIAKEYFVKCQEAMLTGQCEDDISSGATISLPNQKVDGEISPEILEEKISGLQYSDVCSEARRCFAAENYDRAVSLLLGHFFPVKQQPRLVDLLREFEFSESVLENDDRRLIDILTESFAKSSTHSADDALLFLVTLLFHVTRFIDDFDKIEEVSGALHPEHILERGLNAIKFILNQLEANVSERAVSDSYQQLLQACCLNCLKPSILLLFDAPKEVFQSICAVVVRSEKAGLNEKESERKSEHSMVIEAVAETFHTIRSFDEANFRDLFAKLPSPVNKKKQSRRDRVRALLVDLLRFLNWSLRYSELSAASDMDAHKKSVLMLHCRTMMKEEEEIVSRREDKTARLLFGNAGILFLLLCCASLGENIDEARKTLADLVSLLHNRMGQYGICGLSYYEGVNGALGAASEGSCFLETSVWVLSKYTDANTARDKSKGKSSENHTDFDNDEEDSPFNKELAQCYHCMYDVQILAGHEDHKTGNSFALLLSDTRTKRPKAMRLAQFAVPILLSRPPKNNSQKRENLKLLCAISDALKETHSMEHAQARLHPQELQSFLAPSNLLEWDGQFPAVDSDIQASSEADESGYHAPLDHLWYLLGENFILSRARRRGNATELVDMEIRVKERVAYLMIDVLYYCPGRVKSWIRLGKTMKELYHATSDACAVILGRKRKIVALHKYTSTLSSLRLVQEDTGHEAQAASSSDKLTFNEVVLGMSLFDKMKQWDDNEPAEQDEFRVSVGCAASEVKDEARLESRAQLFSMEEYTIYYIVQVIEFARRCFAMAAHLAEESLKKKLEAREMKRKVKKTHGRKKQKKVEDADDDEEEIDELRSIVIESNEECGLLLYNVLQEFSVLNQVPGQPFPDAMYLRLATKAFSYFRKGLDVCEDVDDAEEVRFRLSFMCGKTLKKQLRREQKQMELGDGETLREAKQTTPKAIVDYFAMAEKAHEDGEMEHALVHAFYALQAMRMEVVLQQPVRVEDLRLVCEHYFEEGEEEEEESEDESGNDTGNESSASRSVEDTKMKEEVSKDEPVKITKEDVFKLLDKAKPGRNKKNELALHVARGWLYLNVIDALESIPSEDRYFHPSRYVLAQGVYHMDEFVHGSLKTSKDPQAQALLAALTERLTPPGASQDAVAAERALKELTPLFDKKRPQIVAIWLSEHVPTAKKFDELNQRQMKYDRYRLKYWHFYIRLLEESGAYGKIKEVGTWVLACKEEHDVIDEMLGLTLQARGNLLRTRIHRFCSETVQAKTSLAALLHQEDEHGDSVQSAARQQRTAALLKLLAKTYTYYLDIVDSHHRLAAMVDSHHQELLQRGELLVVYLFLLGAVEFAGDFPIQPNSYDDEPSTADDLKSVTERLKVYLIEASAASSPVDVSSAQWKALLDATRAFCEEKWPERMGKGKLAKSRLRLKIPPPAAVPAAATPVTTTTSIMSSSTSAAPATEVTTITVNKMSLENLTTTAETPISVESDIEEGDS